MSRNKGNVVKQSGNDVEGCRSQKVLFQPNMRVFLQYSVKYHALNQTIIEKSCSDELREAKAGKSNQFLENLADALLHSQCFSHCFN